MKEPSSKFSQALFIHEFFTNEARTNSSARNQSKRPQLFAQITFVPRWNGTLKLLLNHPICNDLKTRSPSNSSLAHALH